MSDHGVPAVPPTPDPDDPSRRRVLQYIAAGAVGVAGAGALGWKLLSSDGGSAGQPGPAPQNAPVPTHRTLVVIELGGGNDGLSTLVPYEDGTYHDARPTLALGPDDIVDVEAGWGLNAHLGDAYANGLALVSGVGTTAPDLSHFAMLDRWYQGLPGGAPSTAIGGFSPGFLGRLCDVLAEGDELAGVALQFGEAPIMRAKSAQTLGIGDVTHNPLIDPTVNALVKDRLALLASGATSGPTEAARAQLQPLGGLLGVLSELPEATPSVTYPDNRMGLQLGTAARILRSPSQVRVIHVPHGVSDYDTHGNHAETHGNLLAELGSGLAAFQADLAENGMTDQVLIATISEFGRRVAESGGGLDHGAASTMLLSGPVHAGLHGELPVLTDLDEYGNLRSAYDFDRYYATLAAWLDVDPGQVLEQGPSGRVAEPFSGVVRI